jgi:uncharacterized membrane protein (DUF2068 family)
MSEVAREHRLVGTPGHGSARTAAGVNRPSHWLADLWLRVIAGFKLVKATLLVAAGIAALGMLNPNLARPMTRWAMDLAADHHFDLLDTVIRHVIDVKPRTLRLVSVGSLLYALLFYTEGVGLYFDRRWAEYMTIVTTAALIPFEVFEIVRHETWTKLGVLVANVLIVVYLAWRVNAKLERSRA